MNQKYIETKLNLNPNHLDNNNSNNKNKILYLLKLIEKV